MKNKWQLINCLCGIIIGFLFCWIIKLPEIIEIETQKRIGLDPDTEFHVALARGDPQQYACRVVNLKEIESIQLPKEWREILIGDVRWLILDLHTYKIHVANYNCDTKKIESRPLNIRSSRRWGFKDQILELKAVGSTSGLIYLYASQRYYFEKNNKAEIYKLGGYIPQRPGGLYDDEETQLNE